MSWRATIVLLLFSVCSPGQEQPQLPDAPSTQNNTESNAIKVNWLYGAYVPKDVELRSLNNHERGQLYLRQTYLTWGIYLKTAFFALSDQANGSPSQWGGGFGGYGKRVASRYGQFAIQNTLSTTGNLLLRYEPRYERCRCLGAWPRVGHALARNFVTYNQTERERRPQVALYAGAMGAGMISSTWKPGRNDMWTEGYHSIAAQAAFGSFTNVLSEFAPELGRLLKRNKK